MKHESKLRSLEPSHLPSPAAQETQTPRAKRLAAGRRGHFKTSDIA